MWSKTLRYNVQYRPKTTVSLRYFWPSSNNPFLQEKVEIDTEKVEIDTEKNASLSQLQVPDLQILHFISLIMEALMDGIPHFFFVV